MTLSYARHTLKITDGPVDTHIELVLPKGEMITVINSSICFHSTHEILHEKGSGVGHLNGFRKLKRLFVGQQTNCMGHCVVLCTETPSLSVFNTEIIIAIISQIFQIYYQIIMIFLYIIQWNTLVFIIMLSNLSPFKHLNIQFICN